MDDRNNGPGDVDKDEDNNEDGNNDDDVASCTAT